MPASLGAGLTPLTVGITQSFQTNPHAQCARVDAHRASRFLSERARRGLNRMPRLRIIAGCERKSMSLRKVTLFHKEGSAVEPTDEDGQAKPAVLGVRWVNPHTFETIRVRGGKRTGPKSEVIEEIPPTLDLSPFAIDLLDRARRKPAK